MFMSCGYYIFAMAGRLTRLPVAMQIIIKGNIIIVIIILLYLRATQPCSVPGLILILWGKFTSTDVFFGWRLFSL